MTGEDQAVEETRREMKKSWRKRSMMPSNPGLRSCRFLSERVRERTVPEVYETYRQRTTELFQQPQLHREVVRKPAAASVTVAREFRFGTRNEDLSYSRATARTARLPAVNAPMDDDIRG